MKALLAFALLAALPSAHAALVAPAPSTSRTTLLSPRSDASARESSFWDHLGTHTNFNYFGQFNGPAFGRPLIENHNVYEEGPWPIYLYHELTLGFRPTRAFTFGVGLAATQDLAEGVTNRWGNPVKPSFTVFHPRVYAGHSSLLETSWLRVSGEVSLLLPTSDYAQQERVLGAVAFDQTLNFKLPDRRWTFNLTTKIQPTFYQYALPLDYDGFQRETLFVTAGHYLSYHFSPSWELSTTSLFDANHMSNAADGLLDFGSAAEDRMKLQLDYYHGSGIFRLGAFVQSVLAHPRLNSSIVGANLTINFLRSRY